MSRKKIIIDISHVYWNHQNEKYTLTCWKWWNKLRALRNGNMNQPLPKFKQKLSEKSILCL